jgi:hypothetical protein
MGANYMPVAMPHTSISCMDYERWRAPPRSVEATAMYFARLMGVTAMVGLVQGFRVFKVYPP